MTISRGCQERKIRLQLPAAPTMLLLEPILTLAFPVIDPWTIITPASEPDTASVNASGRVVSSPSSDSPILMLAWTIALVDWAPTPPSTSSSRCCRHRRRLLDPELVSAQESGARRIRRDKRRGRERATEAC